jgi:hypothetical protein
MIWLAWRQHRGEAFTVAGALALVAALLVISGRSMATFIQQFGVEACFGHTLGNANCGVIVSDFKSQFGLLILAVSFINLLLPAALAIFVGSPLVAREVEQGTFRLVWTQSVTRGRWQAYKLAFVIGGALVAWGALTAVLMWWFAPLDRFGAFYVSDSFDSEGTVPLAVIGFALAFAIAAGALLRRTIPAMVLTLVALVVVRLPVEVLLRPRYLPPLTYTWDPSLPASQLDRSAWQINTSWIDRAGHTLGDTFVFNTCSSSGPNDSSAFFQCTHAHGWLLQTLYQPADRFPVMRALETGIYLALTVALLALLMWWVRRRIA